MTFLKSVMFLGVVAGLAACGKTNDAKQAAQNIKAVQQNGGSPTLEGAYAKCEGPRLKGLGTLDFLSSKVRYELDPVKFKKVIAYYSKPGCEGESVIVEKSGKVNVVNSPQPGEATQEDITYDPTISIKTEGATALGIMNAEGFCGSKEWVLNTAKDVPANEKGQTCFGDDTPTTVQELFQVKDNNLYLGADADKAQRPTSVDFNTPYGKEN